ncbi:hypothetical protein DRQ50_05545 [bacterium]|nr:MAG: hypothetical protein DRQ50_05545 [bacterium]
MSLSIHRRRVLPDVVCLGAIVLLATAPMWRMGWLRDDWLFLWRALEPASAPPGAAGVFPRPVADLFWKFSTFVAGDAPWSMHVLVLLAWLVLAAGLVRWHRAWGGGTMGALLAVFVLTAHGALVEPRLWASAGNGVLAAALAIWGVWLLREDGIRPWRFGLGAVLLALGILARADAVLLLALPLAERRRCELSGWSTVGLMGAALLAWMMVAAGDMPVVAPAAGGRLLRLLLVPWGPPLPVFGAMALGVGGLAGAAVVVVRSTRQRPVALAAIAGAVVLAGSVTGWSPAGRYVLMPTIALALLLGAAEGRNRLLLVPWLALHLAGIWFGNTTADLLGRSTAETGLYRVVRDAPGPLDRLVVQDPPPLGWTGSAADAENVASAARRRSVAVAIRGSDLPVADSWAAVRWDGAAWILSPPAHDPRP